MPLKNKFYFFVVAAAYFVAALFALVATADAEEAADAVGEQQLVVGPAQHATNLTSVEPWVINGEVAGSVAFYVYKDVSTDRPVDYWEVYDKDGDLLAVGWFDRFGIQRSAVDEGILHDEGKIDGVFVMVIDGEFI
jgi:uncharacterized protein YcfL